MIFEFKNRSSAIKFVLVFFVLLATVTVLIWLYSSNAKKQQAQFSQDLQTLQKSYFSDGSISTTDFVSKLEALDKGSLHRSSSNEAMAQLLIGQGRLSASPSEGIAAIKTVAENKNYDLNFRCYAMALLATFYDFYPDRDFAKNEIFNDAFFNQFIKDNPEDMDLGFKNLNDFIDRNSSPAIISKYRIALWYSGEILNNSNLSDSEKENYLSKVNQNIEKADSLMKLGNSYSFSSTVLVSRLKAETFQNLYFAKKGEVTLDKVETYYKQSLIFGSNQGKTDKRLERDTAYSRFYYADFLARVDKDARANDIKNILAPLYDVTIRNYEVFNFLKLAGNNSNSQYHNDIAALSDIDPKFKSLMGQL